MPDETVIDIGELWDGEMARVQAGSTYLLVANIAGRIIACEDRCPHQGVPLSKGRMEGAKLTCAAHLWQFDLLTGRGINPDAARLNLYHVRPVGTGRIAVSREARQAEGLGGAHG